MSSKPGGSWAMTFSSASTSSAITTPKKGLGTGTGPSIRSGGRRRSRYGMPSPNPPRNKWETGFFEHAPRLDRGDKKHIEWVKRRLSDEEKIPNPSYMPCPIYHFFAFSGLWPDVSPQGQAAGPDDVGRPKQ